MSDMIDKVAKAIYDSHGFVKGWNHPDTHDVWRLTMRMEARAAIEALRVPTDEMMQASIDSGADDFGGMGIRDYEIAFTAAIDAALGEQEK